jgi:GntR family transcriptional regulator/MocR family aminotransferase
MSDQWATSGLDLHLDVSGPGVRAALERGLRNAVRDGRLAPGARLPSTRSLAADLGVARNTVADAYDQLVAEGWLVARRGSGTHVSARVPHPDTAPARVAAAPSPARFDLTPGSPDVSAFPRALWVRTLQQALVEAPADALGYSDPRGVPELRTALAGYLGRVRGVDVRPDRMIVCSGFSQALALTGGVLAAAGGETVGIESFSIEAHRAALEAAGLRARAVPVDASGADLDGLGPAAAALLTPAHQFPTGAVLSPDRRRRAVDWAAENDAVVIEDDYDGEFRYDRHPVGAMQALAPDRVVYIGTASKTLAPGIRLGWLAAPTHLVEPLVEAKRLGDTHTHVLDQLVLARLLERGDYDRHVRRQRAVYRRRRNMLVGELAAAAPEARVTGIAAGLHALVLLPPGRTELDVVAAARRRGLVVQGLGEYQTGAPEAVQAFPPALVVGYGRPPEHAFTGAVARLVAALVERPLRP